MSDAILVTGVGLKTPLGSTWNEFASHLLAGNSGVTRVAPEMSRGGPVEIAGGIGVIEAPPGVAPDFFAQQHRLDQVAMFGIVQALHDSGWWERRHEARIGVLLGMGAEQARVWELDNDAGGDRVYEPAKDQDTLLERVCSHLELSGPVAGVAAACASANYALSQARRWLKYGWVDVCLAGGCDLVTPLSLAGFANLRALSRRNDAPAAASRPFDRQRDGFVVGEGSAVLVLERASSATRRGAKVYGEFAGFGASSDASHMIIPSDDPIPASQAMGRALVDAGVNPSEVGYVNAHATSTPVGDRAESRALRLVLGDAITQVPVSSTKSMTGHLLSAAAAVEALACLVAIQNNVAPPTINLDDPDPDCDLRHVPNQAIESPIRVAMSNSFGFGGSNTSAVFRRAAA